MKRSKISQKEQNYFDSSKKELILILENEEERLRETPWTLMEKYIPKHSYTSQSYKTRGYYESILISLGSVDIQHFPEKSININYSKFIIKKIISIQEWGLSPSVERQVINPVTKQFFQYNYWDYQESFYKILFYQNPKHSHTWLIKICENIGRNQIPNWFIEWWNN